MNVFIVGRNGPAYLSGTAVETVDWVYLDEVQVTMQSMMPTSRMLPEIVKRGQDVHILRKSHGDRTKYHDCEVVMKFVNIGKPSWWMHGVVANEPTGMQQVMLNWDFTATLEFPDA